MIPCGFSHEGAFARILNSKLRNVEDLFYRISHEFASTESESPDIPYIQEAINTFKYEQVKLTKVNNKFAGFLSTSVSI